jgi:hypothetical protein
MIYGQTVLTQPPKPKRKVFVSYYHADDQAYRDAFEKAFGHIFISKSVQPENIKTDLSTDYIKSLIHDGYISDCTVLIVLIGPNTYGRKHVDWEVSGALNYKVGDGYAGLFGILLPTFQLQPENRYNYADMLTSIFGVQSVLQKQTSPILSKRHIKIV